MFAILFPTMCAIYCVSRYFTPPTNFDCPPSKEVKEWMETGGASRKAAELLVWHGVYYKNPGSPAAEQLIRSGGGWTWVAAELKIRGYKAGKDGWSNPVRT
jgi:hypothetical protein